MKGMAGTGQSVDNSSPNQASTGSHPRCRDEEAASPTTCITLLTGGLLSWRVVALAEAGCIQPEEPTLSMSCAEPLMPTL
jgi:hypothetical protein